MCDFRVQLIRAYFLQPHWGQEAFDEQVRCLKGSYTRARRQRLRIYTGCDANGSSGSVLSAEELPYIGNVGEQRDARGQMFLDIAIQFDLFAANTIDEVPMEARITRPGRLAGGDRY